MNKHLSDWTRTTFGHVLHQRKEAGFTNEELLAVTSSLGIVKRDTLERRDTSNEDKSKYLLVRKGDIAYNTMRMWQGVSGVSRFRGIVSPAYTICAPNNELDADFAGYMLKDPQMVSVFRQRSQGLVSDTWNLKYQSFAQIPCLLPPLPEQKKIAEILSGIDTNLCYHKKKANKCQKLIAAMEVNAFDVFRKDDLIRHKLASDKGSQVVSLGDIFDFRNGLNYSKGNTGTGLKVVGVGDFKNYRTPKYESLGELSPEGLDFGLSLLEEGDFLFVRSNGNRLLIGRCLSIERIPGGIPVVHSGFTIRARPKSQNSYSTNYIKQLLQSRVFRRSVADLGGGTNISNLSQDILAETMIAFPSTSVQEKVSSGLLAIQDFYELTQAKLKQLEATKVALTSDLLSGRKRVSV